MFIDSLYANLLRPIVFQVDPELAHKIAIATVKNISKFPNLQKITSSQFTYSHPVLRQKIWNLEFANPIGLAAGFDKNGEGIGAWQALGFGFAEIGTITAHPQVGNPQPRLFRLVADQAILNRMGFNNWGADQIAQSIHQFRQNYSLKIPIGINLGKSKITPLECASQDYLTSFQLCQTLGDYFVVNVSSPNTVGLRSLQSVSALTEIITMLQTVNNYQRPLLVKIAPDLSYAEIDDLLQVCFDQKISGIIATNTTIDRTHIKAQQYHQEMGGISGKPLQTKSTAIIRHIYRSSQGQLPIVGVGGIDSADSAWDKLRAGASLLQIYTGLVYHGFGLTRQILQGLTQKLTASGCPTLASIIGIDA